jgi:N-acetylneuraminic acid mutarotase
MDHLLSLYKRLFFSLPDLAPRAFHGLQRAIPLVAMGLTLVVSGFLCPAANAQTNEWTWMSGSITAGSFGVYGTLGKPAPGNTPGAREQPVSWTDSKGNLWLFGGDGGDSAGDSGYLNDLWEFNPSSNEWTWMGGSSTLPSGHVGPGAYGTLGTSAAGNIPPGRAGAVSWTDGNGNLWLFGGYYQDFTGTGGLASFNDLWKFNPSANQWTWMSGSNTPNQSAVYGTLGTPAPGNVPGARSDAVSWTDSKGNFWLFGGEGYDSAGNQGGLNDLWEFSPSTNLWTWVNGPNTANQPSVSGTLLTPAPGNLPPARNGATSWIDSSGNLWLFGGNGARNDLWEFNPSTNEWAWMSGTVTGQVYAAGPPGVYGTLQTPAAGNTPGSRTGAVGWTDSKGNLWMFGGVGYDASDTQGMLNDLWEFNTSTNEWTWMGGSATADGICGILANWCGQAGVYGTLQIPALANVPGGRYNGVSWTDSKGNFWLFGGCGYDGLGRPGCLNDLWEFQPNTGAQSVVATPVISPDSGTYTSWQTVTITDSTPGATISYLVNGLPPASEYTGPISVSSSETIEAIANASGYANSNIATATYVEDLPQAATPTFSPAPGTYSAAQTVTISDTTPGATIYYAIGATPTVPSTLYSGPLTVSSSETIQAIAVVGNYLNSNIATAAYKIGSNPTAEWTWMGGSSTVPTSCPNANTCGQPGWYGTLQTPAATNVPGGRRETVSWTDSKGNLWLFGGVGYDSVDVLGYLNDLWEYSPSTGEWAWMGGSNTVTCPSSNICSQSGVYGTLGTPAAGNIPGGRFNASGWTDKQGNLWLFGGQGFDANGTQGDLNDLWEFDPSTNEWTWMGGSSTLPCEEAAADECWGQPGVYGTFGTPAAGNIPGARDSATSWSDRNGNFWIYGGFGRDAREIECYLNDLWEYDPAANEWTWRGGYKSCPNVNLSGWPGLFGTLGVFAAANNPWSLVFTASWVDSSNNLWLFGGMGEDTAAVGYYLNDMWEFNPSIDEWAWTSASSVNGGIGVYGTMGDWSPGNIPGGRTGPASWTDSNGSFWLFGGLGLASNSFGMLNDLWEFKPSINEWAWMGGSNAVVCLRSTSGICVSWGPAGAYGTLGTPSSGNAPGSRYSGATWTDSAGNLWLFGGYGDVAQGNGGYLNDMWQYGLNSSPSVPPPMPAATPSFSLAAGTYASAQTLTISDQTPGAVIYYTTNGTMPNVSSSVYKGQIATASSETVNAIAVSSGSSISAVATASYTISTPQTATPTFNVPQGTYTTVQSVSISDTTPGATIYYTTNGNAPTTSSSVYSGPITVVSTETLNAIALSSGYSTSAVATAAYTINLAGPPFSIAGTTVTVIPGATSGNTSSITVTPSEGFTGSVTLTAAIATSPAGAQYLPTLSFGTTTPVSITSAGAGTATLTISTTSATSAALISPKHPGVSWYAAGGTALACVLLFGIPARRRSWRTLLGLVVFLVFLTGGVLSCGGGGGVGGGGGSGRGNPGTTAGAYTITVTGTSGSTTEAGTITLNVQ